MIYGDPIILGGGGSGGDVYAFILATYPAGSVCTASSGSTTLTAGDTSGSWVFKIPAAGTWTVTSTDGTDTATATVVISTEGQSESISLSYRLFIVHTGVALETLTPTAAQLTEKDGYLEWKGGQVVALLKAQVDLTEYAKMVVVVSGGLSWYGGQTPALGFSTTNPTINSNTGAVTPHNVFTSLNSSQGAIAAGTYEVDISTYSGTQYVWLSMAYYGANIPYIDIVDWYLE